MKLPYFLRPGIFIIQWHITERCNWDCRHCYRDSTRSPEAHNLDFKDLICQCIEVFRALGIKRRFARLNIGGGEPFLRKDIFNFLSFISRYKNSCHLSIMTNGSFITEEVAKEIKKFKIVESIQVSLEGLRETNDQIRPKGSFDIVTQALECLNRHSIPTRVSLTVTRRNVSEISRFIKYMKEIGVMVVGLRRLVPMGSGKALQKDMLLPNELKDFYRKREMLKKKFDEPGKFYVSYGCEDGCFLVQRNNSTPGACGVAKGHVLSMMPNGDVLACRRFPQVVGNVFKNRLLEIYFASKKLQDYRESGNAHPLCKKCRFFKNCRGGAKCVTQAYFGTPWAPDPQCWHVFKDLPDPGMVKG